MRWIRGICQMRWIRRICRIRWVHRIRQVCWIRQIRRARQVRCISRIYVRIRRIRVLKIAVMYMLSSASFTITKENYNPLLWRKCSLKFDLKKSDFLKAFCNLFVFGFFFKIIKKKGKRKTMIFYGKENVHWN